MLLGDRGTYVWTTCPRLLAESETAGSRTCDQHPDHHYTDWLYTHSVVALAMRHRLQWFIRLQPTIAKVHYSQTLALTLTLTLTLNFAMIDFGYSGLTPIMTDYRLSTDGLTASAIRLHSSWNIWHTLCLPYGFRRPTYRMMNTGIACL